MTQGSSCLATLGSGTESRWDSRTERDSASRSRFANTEMVGCFRLTIACGTLAVRRPALRTIPKGLGPPTQGWRATPTLGARSAIESTPTALWLRSGARAGMDGPQPRCGCGCFSDDDPG